MFPAKINSPTSQHVPIWKVSFLVPIIVHSIISLPVQCQPNHWHPPPPCQQTCEYQDSSPDNLTNKWSYKYFLNIVAMFPSDKIFYTQPQNTSGGGVTSWSQAEPHLISDQCRWGAAGAKYGRVCVLATLQRNRPFVIVIQTNLQFTGGKPYFPTNER